MNTLQTLEIFLRTAQMKSFTKAAESLGLSRATVSRSVAALEDAVGKPLLVRTTRCVALTEVGRSFCEQAERLSRDAEALLTPADVDAPLAGSLRLASTPGLAEFFLGEAAEVFTDEYPGMSLDVRIEPAPVDLVATATDLAFLVTSVPPEDAVVLGRCSSWLCAAPAYLEKAGIPEAPEMLSLHALVAQPGSEVWTMANQDGETRRVKATGRLTFSGVSLVIAAVKRARGIGLLPDIAAEPEVAAGRLVRVLPEWHFPESHLVVRRAPGRVAHRAAEAFVAFVKMRLVEKNSQKAESTPKSAARTAA